MDTTTFKIANKQPMEFYWVGGNEKELISNPPIADSLQKANDWTATTDYFAACPLDIVRLLFAYMSDTTSAQFSFTSTSMREVFCQLALNGTEEEVNALIQRELDSRSEFDRFLQKMNPFAPKEKSPKDMTAREKFNYPVCLKDNFTTATKTGRNYLGELRINRHYTVYRIRNKFLTIEQALQNRRATMVGISENFKARDRVKYLPHKILGNIIDEVLTVDQAINMSQWTRPIVNEELIQAKFFINPWLAQAFLNLPYELKKEIISESGIIRPILTRYKLDMNQIMNAPLYNGQHILELLSQFRWAFEYQKIVTIEQITESNESKGKDIIKALRNPRLWHNDTQDNDWRPREAVRHRNKINMANVIKLGYEFMSRVNRDKWHKSTIYRNQKNGNLYLNSPPSAQDRLKSVWIQEAISDKKITVEQVLSAPCIENEEYPLCISDVQNAINKGYLTIQEATTTSLTQMLSLITERSSQDKGFFGGLFSWVDQFSTTHSKGGEQ